MLKPKIVIWRIQMCYSKYHGVNIFSLKKITRDDKCNHIDIEQAWHFETFGHLV